MIKAVSIYTQEIDDMDLACSQLKTQMGEKITLLKSTVGIVQCNPEFIESGILDTLYRELNIPLAGGTTVASATNDAVGSLMLSILVLTSDDVEFVVSYTHGFEDDCMGSVKKSFDETLAKPRRLGEAPLKMVLVFPPIIDAIAGDTYIDAIENVCGKTPVFGTLSVDDSLHLFERSASVYNDVILKREMAYVLVFGNVNPRFAVATVPRLSNLDESNAVITKASGNIAYEINNKPSIDYFEKVGFASEGKFKDGSVLIPLLVTPPDGQDQVPFVRALINNTNPDGSIMVRGNIPEGASINFGSTSRDDVLSSTLNTVTGIKHEKDGSAALLFTCIVRQLVIGADSLRELNQMKDTLGPDIPFIASYAGGEISPTSVNDEKRAQNRFHNYSFIVCLL